MKYGYINEQASESSLHIPNDRLQKKKASRLLITSHPAGTKKHGTFVDRTCFLCLI